MAHATAQNVATRLMRPLAQSERLAVEEFLTDVESDIVDRYPDILTADERRLRNLLRVECAVVIRHLRNRDNAKRTIRTRAVDDYNETDTVERYDSAAAGSELAPTDDEWASLAPAGETTSSATAEAFTIRLAY